MNRLNKRGFIVSNRQNAIQSLRDALAKLRQVPRSELHRILGPDFGDQVYMTRWKLGCYLDEPGANPAPVQDDGVDPTIARTAKAIRSLERQHRRVYGPYAGFVRLAQQQEADRREAKRIEASRETDDVHGEESDG